MKPDPWISRVYREFEAGNLTRGARDVLVVLARFAAMPAGAFPSHATLAARANCSTRTVQRALQAARELGLVDWTVRRIKVAWRSLRLSNRYVLTVPETAVAGRCRTTGQKAQGSTNERKKEAREGALAGLCAMLEAARCLPDLLKARREAWALSRLGGVG